MILSEFPGRYPQSTVDQIERAATSGDWDARKALKILFRAGFDK